MKIWLDDLREPPDSSWIWRKDVMGCLRLIKTLLAAPKGDQEILTIDFDHDLGEDLTGYTVACWLEEHADLFEQPIEWNVHSWNPVGAPKIVSAMRSFDRIFHRLN